MDPEAPAPPADATYLPSSEAGAAPGLERLVKRMHALLDRVEDWLPARGAQIDWNAVRALRWRRLHGRGLLEPVAHPHQLRLQDLHCIELQKSEIVRNTRQFLAGLPANNVLLWGSRGTGKSSLIKALLNEFGAAGLRLIEVEKHDLVDLPEIIAAVRGRTQRVVLFCDDLSFGADEPAYKTLKAALDGSVSAVPDNLLIYASSNRRHLLPEHMQDNRETRMQDGELHPSEATEEKISLSERFGIWLSFYPFTQDQYLEIVAHWLGQLQALPEDAESTRAAALRWALARGSRSGRAAWQFARDWAGRCALEQRQARERGG